MMINDTVHMTVLILTFLYLHISLMFKDFQGLQPYVQQLCIYHWKNLWKQQNNCPSLLEPTGDIPSPSFPVVQNKSNNGPNKEKSC